MLESDMEDKLLQAIKSIDTNFVRIDYALKQLEGYLPLTSENYYSIEPQSIEYIDQYIFRFAKCQDLIGEKLFRLILITAEEDIEKESFLNILNKLEKFEIFNDKSEWLALRKLRNMVSHEYPTLDEESLMALNCLFDSVGVLKTIYKNCLDFLIINKIIVD